MGGVPGSSPPGGLRPRRLRRAPVRLLSRSSAGHPGPRRLGPRPGRRRSNHSFGGVYFGGTARGRAVDSIVRAGVPGRRGSVLHWSRCKLHARAEWRELTQRSIINQRREIQLEKRRFLGRRPEFLAVCRVIVFFRGSVLAVAPWLGILCIFSRLRCAVVGDSFGTPVLAPGESARRGRDRAAPRFR